MNGLVPASLPHKICPPIVCRPAVPNFNFDITESIEDGIDPERGHIATLVRSHLNGLQPFESTIKQTTEAMPLAQEAVFKGSRSFEKAAFYALVRQGYQISAFFPSF